MKKLISFSRSYLTFLMPEIEKRTPNIKWYHIVQNSCEEKYLHGKGCNVVLNLQNIIKINISNKSIKKWTEPSDFRTVTRFNWCPVLADRNLINFNENDRFVVCGILQEFIKRIFSTYKFNLFLSEPVVLFPTHLMYYFSQKNRVKSIFWSPSYLPNYFYFSNGCNTREPHPSKILDKKENLNLKKELNMFISGVKNDLSGPIYHPKFASLLDKKANYLKQRQGKASLVYTIGVKTVFIQFLRLLRAIYKKALFYFDGDYIAAGAISEHIFYLKCMLYDRKKYQHVSALIHKRYIVYPLQFEPEGSLTYFAPEIEDQHSLVETILRALPSGMLLCVKEHPNQCGALQMAEWQQLCKKYRSLRIINGRESGRLLVKNAYMVITISSTLGMDALILGKKVIVLGSVFYENFKNVIKINSIEKLATIINSKWALVGTKNNISVKQQLFSFVKKSWSGDPQPSVNLFSENNLNKLAVAINQYALRKASINKEQ